MNKFNLFALKSVNRICIFMLIILTYIQHGFRSFKFTSIGAFTIGK